MNEYDGACKQSVVLKNNATLTFFQGTIIDVIAFMIITFFSYFQISA